MRKAVSQTENIVRARTRKALLMAAVAAVGPLAARNALASVSYTGGVLSENFDTLSNVVGNTPTWSATLGTQAPVPGLTSWDGVKIAGTGTTPMNFTVDDPPGSAASGAIYSYGPSAGADRALGSIASATNTPTFGVEIVNNTAFTMTKFTLGFTAEQWRSSTATLNSLAFSYGVTGGGMNSGNYLSSPTMISFAGLNAPGKAPVGANGPTDGNDPLNQTAVSATVTGVVIPAGSSLFIRWADFNDLGNDAGIGIDNLTFSSPPPLGANLNWNGTGGNSTWSVGGPTNWLVGATPTAFANNDTANFTQAGIATGSTVTIAAGGVLPENTFVSNTSGTYTFNGPGGIGGTGALVKTNAGNLVINSANSYSGGTVINGGLVTISADNNLGAAAGGLTLGGGSLRISASIASARAVTLAGVNPNTIDTNGFNSSFSGNVTGNGPLIKTGAGALTFSGNYNANGNLSIAAGSVVLAQPSGIVTIGTGGGGTDFVGDLSLTNAIQLNFNTGVFSGGGKIRVNASGSTLGNTGTGQTAVVGNEIILNPLSIGGFSTNINSVFGNTLTLGLISGSSDVVYSILPTGPIGGGILVLAAQNTYTGSSTILNTSGGVIRLGTNNALPNTALVFGNGTVGNIGALDLAGFNQSVSSLSVNSAGIINGIANSTGTTSVLSITGSSTTTYSGTIGIPANISQLPTATDAIALTLTSAHTGELELTGINTYTGGTTINGGRLKISSDANIGAASGPLTFGTGGRLVTTAGITSGRTVTVNAGGGVIDTNGFDSTFSTSPSGAGALTKAGAGILTVNSVNTGGLTVSTGRLRVSAGGSNNTVAKLSKLTGPLSIAGGPATPTATLDLTNNAMVITGGSVPTTNDARQLIRAAYNAGGWNGPGGISTSNGTVANFAIGYATAGSVGITNFLGAGANLPTDMLFRFTRYGDANIDGLVNTNDFTALAGNFNQTGKVWAQGDFNYDGTVNVNDFSLLAGNFNLAATGADGTITPQDWANLAAAVPEPGSIALIGLAATGMLARRRRRE